ncbi:hypothetical protein AWB81_02331 [Caballeronia arationis]|nr:hypothetical protein AWB81_02331 [Caballeronia arationis]
MREGPGGGYSGGTAKGPVERMIVVRRGYRAKGRPLGANGTAYSRRRPAESRPSVNETSNHKSI